MSASGQLRRSTPKDDWATPPEFMAALAEEFAFTLDVCADARNAKAPKWLEGPCVKLDGVPPGGYMNPCACGLCSYWYDNICFLNPPYSDIRPWVMAADEASGLGATVVALLPASHGNDWYALASGSCSEERRVRERIQFIHPQGCECKACLEGHKGSNTTDSFLFVWRPGPDRWLTHSARVGLWSWRS